MKITDLQFYSGINSEPNIFFNKDANGYVSANKIIYTQAVYSDVIDITWDPNASSPENLIFSKKTNFPPTASSTETIASFLKYSYATTPSDTTITTNLDLTAINSNENGNVSVDQNSTSIPYIPPMRGFFPGLSPVGAGLIAKRTLYSTVHDKIYAGYLNSVVIYETLGGASFDVVNSITVSFDIIDISLPTFADENILYAISEDQVYKIDMTLQTVTVTTDIFTGGIINFTALAIDETDVTNTIIAGQYFNLGPAYAISNGASTEVRTAEFFQTTFSDIPRIVKMPDGEGLVDGIFLLIARSNDSGGGRFLEIDIATLNVTTALTTTDNFNDLDFQLMFGFTTYFFASSATDGFWYQVRGVTGLVKAGGLWTETALNTVQTQYLSFGDPDRIFLYACPSNFTCFQVQFDVGTGGVVTVGAANNVPILQQGVGGIEGTVNLNLISGVNWGIRNITDQRIFFGTFGSGLFEVQSASLNIDAIPVPTPYTPVFKDFIKTDLSKYTILFNSQGASASDSSSQLIEVDIDQEIVTEIGNFGFGIPTDKLWFAANYYMLRRSDDKSRFVFIENVVLDLDDLTTVGGELQTTYAGDIIEILYKRDIFYIVGTSGIEVWENVGAAGFPFRKQDYLSIPYHAPAFFIDEESYQFCPPVSADLQNKFVVITNANQDSEQTILILSGGHYKELKFNFNKIYKTIGVTNSTVLGFSADSYNLWGSEFFILNAIDNTNGEILNSFVIDMAGNCYKQDYSFYTQNIIKSSLNPLRFLYFFDEDPLRIGIQEGDDNFSSISDSILTFPLQMDSSLVRSQTSDVIQVRSILIRLSYPHGPLDTYVDSNGDVYVDSNGDAYVATEYLLPDGREYNISISSDEGIIWTIIKTYTGDQITASLKTIIITNLGTYGSVMVRFESNIPVNVLSAAIKYEEVGVTI